MRGIFDEQKSSLAVTGQTTRWSHQKYDVYLNGNLYLPEPELSKLLEAIAISGVTRNLISRLHGRFSIVVHDKVHNRVLFVRDHFGQQPLYHCQEEGKLIFASSARELRVLSKQGWSVDLRGLYDYFALKYSVPTSTLISEVSEQSPGTILEYVGGSLSAEQPYFEKVPDTPLHNQEEDDVWLSTLKEDFERSVGETCFDAESSRVAVLSSGGIDSSVLVAAYRRLTEDRFATFYVGCLGYKNDKAKEAEYISELFGTAHQNFYIDGREFASNLAPTIEINDFPLNSPSTVLRNCLYSKICGEVDILLSGEGADCLYGGYYIFDLVYRFFLKTHLRFVLPSVVRMLPLSVIPGDIGRKLRLVACAITESPYEYFLNHDTVVVNNRTQLSALFDRYDESYYLPEYKKALAGYTSANVLNRILSIYQSTYLSENLATLAKLEGAYGVQHRHPFISNSMKEAFNRISWDRKVGGFSRKRLIIEMAKDYLPEAFLRSRKEGFGVPLVDWFRDPSALGQYVDLINSRDFRDRGLFKRSYIDKLLSDYQNNRLEDELYERVLWPMVNFEIWLDGLKRR